VQLIRNILIVIAAGWVLLAFHNHRAAVGTLLESNRTESGLSETVVVTYNDSEELIGKLRELKTGQKLDLQYVGGPPEFVSTGISCSDIVAKAAFKQKNEQELEEQVRAINAELARIQGIQQ
jgi:hypothetical protein